VVFFIDHDARSTMSKVRTDISMSLDGFVAGPDADMENPLGIGGEQLHDWITGLASWRDPHGLEGGETTPDDDLVRESRASTGAVIMGRRMYSGGSGPWEQDPNPEGWWGEEPPFDTPVFVLTHHAREPKPMPGDNAFVFVEGIEAALEQARAAAGEKDVLVAGGGEAVQQYLAAGLLDEIHVHVAPVLLGGGAPLFATGAPGGKLEIDRVVASPAVTHLRYRVLR
jgi:dihydrofolate reductase